MKTKQAFNPYLPSWEYVPDAEPHIVGDRVYIYGSHDLFNGINFCLGDYVCWSAPVDDLGNWTYHGCIYKREQDPAAPKIRVTNGLAAPDMVQGDDGRFYLYYFMGGTKMISVAVCALPMRRSVSSDIVCGLIEMRSTPCSRRTASFSRVIVSGLPASTVHSVPKPP